MTVKRNSWAYRMDRELKFGHSEYQQFITLTYKDEDLTVLDKAWKRHYHFKNPFDYAVLKYGDWSDFLARLQKYTKKECGHLQRYYTLLEYGALEKRPHIHIILFSPVREDMTKQFIRDAWDTISKDSIIDYQPITFADISYCAKHNLKQCGGNEFQNFMAPSVTRSSRYNGGIGLEYFLQNPSVTDTYTMLNNFRITMPEFYRKKQKAFQNILQFDTDVQKMVFDNPALLRKLLSLPEMCKYETKQRYALSQVQFNNMYSQMVEYCRLYGVQMPSFELPSDMVGFYRKTILKNAYRENKRLFIKRVNRLRTKTRLKLKYQNMLKTLSKQ